MSSKFIPKSRITNKTNNYIWSNMNVDFSKVVEEETDFKSEKRRIESIDLDKVSFEDVYQLPFHQAKYGTWVYDKTSHFIFQFLDVKQENRKEIVDILNGEKQSEMTQEIVHKDGEILVDGVPIILIRGWGNLTGTGAYNLDSQYACRIQDTLAEYIVNKLSAKN